MDFPGFSAHVGVFTALKLTKRIPPRDARGAASKIRLGRRERAVRVCQLAPPERAPANLDVTA